MVYSATIEKKLRVLEKTCCQSEREDLPPAAQWLRDNARALHSAVSEAGAARQLLKGKKYAALRDWSSQLVQREAGRLNAQAVYRALEEAQQERAFTVRELRAVPQALLLSTVLHLQTVLPDVEQECAEYAQGRNLARLTGRGDASQPLPQSETALCRALEILSESGDMQGVKLLETRLREKDLQPLKVQRSARVHMAETAQRMGGVVDTLRLLPRLRWESFLPRLSVASRLLSKERTFRRMDSAGRNLYLTQVMRISERTGFSEETVCEAALRLACEGEGVQAECGYYLLEDQSALVRSLGKKPLWREKMRRHALGIYMLLLGAGFVLFAAAALFLLPWWGVVPFGFVGVQMAQHMMQRVCARLVPSLPLPRLQNKALPQGQKCLIVVPALLCDRRQALRMLRQLSVLYLANKSARFDFMLLSDFADADAQETPQDRDILEALEMGVQALCDAYGPRFFALHRKRTWDAGESRFIGRERKRGALKMLCQLLCGEETQDALELCAPRAPERWQNRYQAVITLDADTFLPAGAAEKMLGALMHPLQWGRTVLLQPRMTTLPMHLTTRAQEYLGGYGGTDSYNASANDLYEDVFRRGSFMGKGIFEPRAFLESTRDLPDHLILSHDLLEGETAGARLMSDVQCFDGHPRTVRGFLRRTHRWTRGDWQLFPFLRGKKLDKLAKFKIVDNLRLSLMPALRVLALLACAAAGRVGLFVLCALPLFSRRALWNLCLLPSDAFARLDAAFRALWRLFVSHKKMLEWVTAAQGDQGDLAPLKDFAPSLAAGAAMMILSGLSFHIPGFMLGAAWMLYPLWIRHLDAPCGQSPALNEDDRSFLMQTARDTLAFYSAHVNEKTHFLPPDNVQLSPPRGAAMRTSPTNIGMYLLSLCAARKMELIDSDDMLRRMERTVTSLEKLETWHGIPYNWYDIAGLMPLQPRFVSAVDAGNYCLCLMAAAQCARAFMHEGDAALRELPMRLDALYARMQLHRLYDRREDLFYIGYDAESGRMTEGHYDMMASEALLLSYVAIALSQAPEKHWWRLGRTWTRASGGKTLLSWGGTMFEYMLPAIFLPAFRHSALEAAQRGCVRTQMRAVSEGPFGISEAGYARFDEQLNYAYRAFGVRELSLDGDCSDTVRAPYAAALALMQEPQKACNALQQWKSRSMYGAYGFFESEDYAAGDPPRIVCSHMAHHQGMILCAVCNALHDNYLQKLLFSLPRMRAHLPLLNECAPRRVRRLPRPLQLHRDVQAQAPLHIRAQKGMPPEMHVLSGGGVTLLTACTGHSRLMQGDVEWTRFDPFCGAVSGPQLYLRAVREDVCAHLSAGDMLFLSGEWRVHKTAGVFKATSGGCVDPLTGAVVYRVRVRNLTEKPERVQLTLYVEPALETLKIDRAHEAFSNLFISVAQTGAREVHITRRLRSHAGGERQLRVRVLGAQGSAALVMNDRSLFIGRQGSMEKPRGLMLPDEDFVMNDTTEPCAALRINAVVPSSGEETVYFVLGTDKLPENEEQAARAFTLCASRREVIERMLRMDNRQTALMLHLSSRMVLTGVQEKTQRNEGVRALWAQGVSGDVPFALITAQDESELPALSQALRLLACLFEHGVPGEVVLLIPGENNYEQPLRTGCEALLALPTLRTLAGRARILQDTDEVFRAAALSLCHVHIDAALSLRDQVKIAPEPDTLRLSEEQGQLPPIGRLRDFNGFGGFTQENGYVIVPTDTSTPAPWSHMLANEAFGTLLCEQGLMYSHMGNSRLRRITASSQDSVLITPAEEYFVAEGGSALSVTQHARVTYEPGTALYERAGKDLYASLTCFCDNDRPVGMRLVHIKNTGGTARTVQFFAAARFALGEDGRGTHVWVQDGSVHAQNAAMAGEAFFHLDGAKMHTVSPGVYAPQRNKRALQVSGNGTVGILQREAVLQPGQSCDFVVVLGFCEEAAHIPQILEMLSPARSRLRKVRGEWSERLGKLQFFLPDDMLSGYLNGFLPYQIRASRLMLRAGFYQSGGAFGFRDQLQDMLPLVYTEPDRVREHLLLCASRQYTEGDVQHWWHPYGAGVRTRISDDLLFLPYVTARYVYVTGDQDILNASAPYLHSPVLAQDEHDRYETAEVTQQTGTLLEHCLRAIDYVKLSDRDLPLIGGGDWNDGMDAVQGESAWLAFFYLVVLSEFMPLCAKDERRRLKKRYDKLHAAAQKIFCDKWFARAWYPDGRSIGAHNSQVPRIDLISQCFAAFAGMPRAQVITALDEAWEKLHDGRRGLTKLLDPPFVPEEKAGYIGAYLPGVRENGGQYTHAVPWFMRSLLMNGRKDRAFELLHEILPYNHSFDVPSARHYRTEPYALPADVYRWGRGGWTWYTGSAAWLYDVYLRDFLGFDKHGDQVTLRPHLPEGWEECTVLYHFGASRYQLTSGRDTLFTTLDGTRVQGEYITLRDDGRTHEARFPAAR